MVVSNPLKYPSNCPHNRRINALFSYSEWIIPHYQRKKISQNRLDFLFIFLNIIGYLIVF